MRAALIKKHPQSVAIGNRPRKNTEKQKTIFCFATNKESSAALFQQHGRVVFNNVSHFDLLLWIYIFVALYEIPFTWVFCKQSHKNSMLRMLAARVLYVRHETQNCLRKQKTVSLSQFDALDDCPMRSVRVISQLLAAVLHFPSFGEHAQSITNKLWTRFAGKLTSSTAMLLLWGSKKFCLIFKLKRTCSAEMILCFAGDETTSRAERCSFITFGLTSSIMLQNCRIVL